MARLGPVLHTGMLCTGLSEAAAPLPWELARVTNQPHVPRMEGFPGKGSVSAKAATDPDKWAS